MGVGGEEREGGNRKGRRRRKTGKVVLTVNNGWEDVGFCPILDRFFFLLSYLSYM